MRSFLILLVLAGAGYFGWRYYAAQKAETATAAAKPDAQPPGPGPGKPAGPQSPFGAQVETGSTPVPADAPLPAEVKADYDKAEALWTQLTAGGTAPATSPQAPQLDRLYSNVLQGIYNKPGQKTNELKLVQERLSPLGDALFFTKAPYSEDETGLFAMHEVQPGESPSAIARKYGMSSDLLNRLRGRPADDSRMNPGDRLKVVKLRDNGGFMLHIDKGDFYLDCYVGGAFARRYPISHGAPETPTPVGRTRLTGREKDPSWTHPITRGIL